MLQAEIAEIYAKNGKESFVDYQHRLNPIADVTLCELAGYAAFQNHSLRSCEKKILSIIGCSN